MPPGLSSLLSANALSLVALSLLSLPWEAFQWLIVNQRVILGTCIGSWLVMLLGKVVKSFEEIRKYLLLYTTSSESVIHLWFPHLISTIENCYFKNSKIDYGHSDGGEVISHNKCWRGCGENGTLLYCWWERKLIQPLWKTVWKFFK